MSYQTRSKNQDPLVGLYFVSFEFGDVDWLGRITSRKNDRYHVALDPVTFFAMSGVVVPLDDEKPKFKYVNVADTADWQFFHTAEERDAWADHYEHSSSKELAS